MQEAKETEGKEPDSASLALGVRSGLDGSAPSTYWVAESKRKGLAQSRKGRYDHHR